MTSCVFDSCPAGCQLAGPDSPTAPAREGFAQNVEDVSEPSTAPSSPCVSTPTVWAVCAKIPGASGSAAPIMPQVLTRGLAFADCYGLLVADISPHAYKSGADTYAAAQKYDQAEENYKKALESQFCQLNPNSIAQIASCSSPSPHCSDHPTSSRSSYLNAHPPLADGFHSFWSRLHLAHLGEGEGIVAVIIGLI